MSSSCSVKVDRTVAMVDSWLEKNRRKAA